MFRRRRPVARLAAGAATATVAYRAGKRHEQGAAEETQPAPVAAPAAAPAATAPDDAAELDKLAALHASGTLTDDEFTAAKAKLLGL